MIYQITVGVKFTVYGPSRYIIMVTSTIDNSLLWLFMLVYIEFML